MVSLPSIAAIQDALSGAGQRGSDQAQAALIEVLRRLPDSVKIRLAGGEPPEIDGDVLDLDVHLTLRNAERLRPDRSGDHLQRRAETRRSSRLAGGRPVEVGAVREMTIPGPTGPLRARHYLPAGDVPGTKPLIVFVHGGGFMAGDVDTHDHPCRMLCRYADAHVISVEYRLAPEDPFPAGLEDAEAAFDWIFERAERIGANPERVVIAGDSAGGNLAAVVCLARRDQGLQQPALQLLIYPAVDSVGSYPSKGLFSEGFFLTTRDMDFFIDAYAPVEQHGDPRISPLLADDHSDLAPAIVVTAAFDPIRDEGEAYAEVLRAAGVPARTIRVPGMVHAFINMGGINDAARAATVDMARTVRGVLDHGWDDAQSKAAR